MIFPSETAPPGHSSDYRKEIDGLRAIAVLAVVLYHFGVPGLPGGFVGVDVFFVLSGFLIGGILWREYTDTGRIALMGFYVRRFKRLMPAFLVVALLSTFVAWHLLLPFEFREYGKTLIAATVYLSNVLFYRSAGYFDTASEEKVLLHTWSLSVEEQFYIFLPLALLLMARVRWLVVPMLIVLFAASLVASIYVTALDQPAAFFLFPFRMWELLAGVLLAIAGQRFGLQWRGWSLFSYLGLALVLASIALIQPDDRFPGVFAIGPVLGTVLLLISGQRDNLVNRLLCSPFMVFFGLISYSLYLWHWPVFTLVSYLRAEPLGLLEASVWIVVSVWLAWLSWRLVELPVRRAGWIPGTAVLGGALVSSLGLLSLGGYLYVKDGVGTRFGPAVQPHIAASADFLQDWSRCSIPADGPLAGLEVCPIGPDGDPEVLVWGDSHVRAYKEGLDLAAHEADRPGVIIWRAGCPPLVGIRKDESYATPLEDLACTNANVQIVQSFNRLPSLTEVLLVGRWAYYSSGVGHGLDAENTISVLPARGALVEGLPQDQIVTGALTETVTDLSQRFAKVHVLRQAPEVPMYDSRRAAREAAHRDWPLAATPVTRSSVDRAEAEARSGTVDTALSELDGFDRVFVIDPWPSLCDDSACYALRDGVGYYFDNNHLTNSAALRLRDHFRSVFGPVTDAAKDPAG